MVLVFLVPFFLTMVLYDAPVTVFGFADWLDDGRTYLKDNAVRVFYLVTLALLLVTAAVCWKVGTAITASERAVRRIVEHDLIRSSGRDSIASPARTMDDERIVIADIVKKLEETAGRLRYQPGSSRLRTIAWALDGTRRDTSNAALVLERLNLGTEIEFPGRPSLQLVVTSLLFLGVIGTFTGLVGVFTSNIFNEILSNPSPLVMERPLGQLMDSFRLAFSSSLVAYVSYLAGRYALDVLDHAHHHMLSLVDNDLVGALKVVMTPLQVQLRVDLPVETKHHLERAADNVAGATEQNKLSLEALTAMSHNISQASKDFGKSLSNLRKSTQTVVRALRDGRKTWHQVQDNWQTSTASFTNSAETLAESVEKQITAVDESRKALNDTVEEITNNWTKSVELILERVDTQAHSIQKQWTEYVRVTLQQLGQAYGEVARKLDEAQRAIQESLGDFGAIQETVLRAAQEVRVGQGEVSRALVQVSDEHQSALARSNELLSAVIDRFESSTADAGTALGSISRSVDRLADLSESLSASIHGEGPSRASPADMIERMNVLLEAVVYDDGLVAGSRGRERG